MAAYIIADIEVTDPVAYEEYRQRVPSIIAAFGGRYLARGGTAERLAGATEAHRVVVLEFPNMARLRTFFASADYQPLIGVRQRASRSSLIALEGL